MKVASVTDRGKWFQTAGGLTLQACRMVESVATNAWCQSITVQWKFNTGHMCHLKFFSSTFKKSKETGKLILIMYFIQQKVPYYFNMSSV